MKIKLRSIAITLCFLTVIASGLLIWQARPNLASNNNEVYRQKLVDGLGSNIHKATPEMSIEESASFVEQATSFLHERSGIEFQQTAKNKLALLELRVSKGEAKYLTLSQLSDLVTNLVLDRVEVFSDTEITDAVEKMKGFNAPELPESFLQARQQGLVKLRYGKQDVNAQDVIAHIQDMRNRRAFYQPLVHQYVKTEFEKRLIVFSENLPQEWGGAWNTSSQTEGSLGISPLQAVTLLYSLAADDALLLSAGNLRQEMGKVQSALAKICNSYPSPNGHYAYGVNGYFYSSPVDLFFDETNFEKLVDSIEKGTAKDE